MEHFHFRERKMRILAKKSIPSYPYRIGRFIYSQKGVEYYADYIVKCKSDEEMLSWLDISLVDAARILIKAKSN